MKISVSMITLNEEKNITRALSSCSFADEIVVVDGGSSDGTIEILKAHDKVVLIQSPWKNHFGRQRQVSLEHCTGEWVIRLDADEAFPQEFEEGIRKLLSSTPADVVGYNIHQCNLVGNEKYYSKIFDNYETNPRIWRNRPAIKWELQVHEILVGLSGTIAQWDVFVVHYGFLDKKRYWQKGEYYTQVPESGIYRQRPEKLFYREYDIQPRPPRSAVAPYVPEYKSEVDPDGMPEIAIVRGPNLNKPEVQNYESVSDKFNMTLYSGDRPNFDLAHIKLPVIKLPSDPEDPAFLKGLEFELFDKDIIFSADILWTFTEQAILAKHKFGKKVIALECENIPFAYEDDGLMREMKQFNRRFTDVFVAVTTRAKDALLLEGVPGEKIVVIPLGTDIERFSPDEAAGKRTRKNLGIAEEEKVVLFSGTIAWEKGIYDLAHAARLVTLEDSIKAVPLKFVIAGQGPESQNIKKCIKELGMDNIFTFIDCYPYHEMQELLNAADIFVFPSIPTKAWREQFGMAVIEAMACGTPVVSTVTGPMDEIVADAGTLVQPNDPTTLSAAIIRLLKDDPLRREFGKKGRERAVREYDSKKIALKFASLFERVFETTYKGALRELAEYTHLPVKDILNRIRSIYSRQVEEWRGLIGDKTTRDKVREFYRDTDSYLFDLVQYNYENLYYMKWTEDIFNFCAELKKQKGDLKILDFGGGIGSQLIALSALKNAELSYADIPGKTFEYAGWRFNRRHLAIDIIDATRGDFLAGRMYDVVITLDVIEHLVDPEAAVEYLLRHIRPGGHLIIVTSFVDNNGEAGWHLNVDRYTDDSFYNFIEKQGMEMLNEGRLPRYFRKPFEDPDDLRPQIYSAISEERFADARNLMETHLEMHLLDLGILVRHAEVCLKLGDCRAASESIEKVVMFSPDMPEAVEIAKEIRRRDNENTSCK
ncbi:MAG: glycosyltransferase [Nitrospiraceae bacterium]|nr:MAG: glycosyltransferase [Nitrospiraceae bacterium]